MSGWCGFAYVCNVISGKEDLSNRLVHMAKQAVPEGNKTALSNSSQGLKKRVSYLAARFLSVLAGGTYLQLSEVLGATLNVHASQTDANSARRHNDDAVAILAQLNGGVDDEGKDGQKRLMRLFVDNGTGA